jgi:hypothetical protein
MKIIAYATHSQGYFEDLKKHPDVVVLGMGTKWEGFTVKAKVISNYIKSLQDDEIVVIVDGFDTIIKKTEGIEEIFKSMNCGVLVSQEDNSGFSKIMPKKVEQYFKKKVFGYCKNDIIANTGLLMGYVKYVKEVYKVMGSDISDDDQRNVNQSCNKLPFLKIDTQHIIFQNCSSIKQVEDSKAYFCQIPGEISISRFARSIPEYSKYFTYEILIFLLIIILVILSVYGSRKKAPGKFRMPSR